MRLVATLLLVGVVATLDCACGRPAAAPVDLDAAVSSAREVQVKQGPRVALPLYERALASARAQQSRKHEGLILGQMGTAYKNLGDYTRALELHQQALAIKRETGDEIEIAKTLNNIGMVEEALANCPHALALYAQSLEIFTRRNAPRFAASVLNNEGLCYDTVGEYRRSLGVYQQALSLHRQQANEVGESEALGNLGGVNLLLGRYVEAATSYEQSLAISTRLEARQSMVLDLINLGSARLGSGDPVVAGVKEQVLGDVQVRVEEVLLGGDAEFRPGLTRGVEHIDAVHEDRPGGRPDNSVNHLQRRRLPGAVRPHEAKAFPPVD